MIWKGGAGRSCSLDGIYAPCLQESCPSHDPNGAEAAKRNMLAAICRSQEREMRRGLMHCAGRGGAPKTGRCNRG